MKILAIDTCTESTSITLLSNDNKYTRSIIGLAKSSGEVLNMCNEIFNEAKIEKKDIQAIAYTQGPGSFTGVRMCISVVQGLSFSLNIPIIGFSTLELLAYKVKKEFKENLIAIALDARMGEIYWGLYKDDILFEQRICNPLEANVLNDNFIGAGSGWSVYEKQLKKITKIKTIKKDLFPHSSDLIDLSIDSFSKGIKAKIDLAKPIYLRNNIAQKSSNICR